MRILVIFCYVVLLLILGCDEKRVNKSKKANKCVYEWRSLRNPNWVGLVTHECGHYRGEFGNEEEGSSHKTFVYLDNGVNILDYNSAKHE